MSDINLSITSTITRNYDMDTLILRILEVDVVNQRATYYYELIGPVVVDNVDISNVSVVEKGHISVPLSDLVQVGEGIPQPLKTRIFTALNLKDGHNTQDESEE